VEVAGPLDAACGGVEEVEETVTAASLVKVRQDGQVSSRRDVVLLGSTGSVGRQALEVVRAHPDRFRVVGLTAGGFNRELFREQAEEFAPGFAGLGADASGEAAALPCDVVLNAISGAAGLQPTLAALDAGNTLALANKESLIIGGPIVTGRARPGQIVPVGRTCTRSPPARHWPTRPGRWARW
jgi:1-deoxy-D-xylulose 5-phosphate reductoisomerase